MKNNIVLIGMPGAGKSTVGVVLAKALGYGFADTDILLSTRIGMTLQDFLDRRGIDEFLKEEELAALSLDCSRTVIATGGSMVLSDTAMNKLKEDSIIVFLDIPMPELIRRLQNFKTRGITLRPGQKIGDIYLERLPLYRKYADITVPDEHGGAPDLEAVVGGIIAELDLYRAEQKERGARP
jgi:shikimate kinase